MFLLAVGMAVGMRLLKVRRVIHSPRAGTMK